MKMNYFEGLVKFFFLIFKFFIVFRLNYDKIKHYVENFVVHFAETIFVDGKFDAKF